MEQYTLIYTNKNNETKTIPLEGNIITEIIYDGRNIYSIRKYSESMPEALTESNHYAFNAIDLTDFTKDCTNINMILINEDGREELLLSIKRITTMISSCQYRPQDMGRRNCYENCSFVEEIRMW